MSFVGGDRREPLGGDFGEPFAGEDEERREAGGVPEDGWLNSAPAVLFGLGVERDVVFFGVWAERLRPARRIWILCDLRPVPTLVFVG